MPDIAKDVSIEEPAADPGEDPGDLLPDLFDAPQEEDIADLPPDLPPDVPDITPEAPEVCVPDCAKKWCGSDGCGGKCGVCAGGTSCDDASKCVFPGTAFGPSKHAHVVDGQFTGFAFGDTWEWYDIKPFASETGPFYFDYDGQYLHMMLDWEIWFQQHPGAIWKLQFHAKGGEEQWTVVIRQGAAKPMVLVNGDPCKECDVEAVVGLGPSPTESSPHVLVEARVKVGSGGFGLQCRGLLNPDQPFEEKSAFVGELGATGGMKLAQDYGQAWIVAVEPHRCVPGQIVHIHGAGFGDSIAPDGVRIGGDHVEIEAWTDTMIVAKVGKDAKGSGCSVHTLSDSVSYLSGVVVVPEWAKAGAFVNVESGPVTVDGQFTGFTSGTAWVKNEWWNVLPVPGENGHAGVRWDGLKLSFAVDWGAAESMGEKDFVGLSGWTDGGKVLWDVKVNGDGSSLIFRNGRNCGCGAKAGGGIGYSPWVDQGKLHMIAEYSIPAGPGPFMFQCRGPVAGKIAGEKAMVSGDAWAGGGLAVWPENASVLVGLLPGEGGAGTPVVAVGTGLGETQGASQLLFAPETPATVSSWDPCMLVTSVPEAAKSGFVRVKLGGGKETNGLWFVVPGSDGDGDGLADDMDNCPGYENAGQADSDEDGVGDACDPDLDGDGFANGLDAFPDDPTEWKDSDADGVGDNSDAFPADPTESKDSDGDGVADAVDNCPLVANADQKDSDGNGKGDACEGLISQGQSCMEILDKGLAKGDGAYVIDPDGDGPTAPVKVWCDMTSDGGGWTLMSVLKSTNSYPCKTAWTDWSDDWFANDHGTPSDMNAAWSNVDARKFKGWVDGTKFTMRVTNPKNSVNRYHFGYKQADWDLWNAGHVVSGVDIIGPFAVDNVKVSTKLDRSGAVTAQCNGFWSWGSLAMGPAPNAQWNDTEGLAARYFTCMTGGYGLVGNQQVESVWHVWVRTSAHAAHCSNGQKDGDETGVDCGGSVCAPCVTAKM